MGLTHDRLCWPHSLSSVGDILILWIQQLSISGIAEF